MRRLIPILAVATLLLSTASAQAAPTCQDSDGATIRCGVAGALPVGQTLSPQQRLERQAPIPATPSLSLLFSLACVLGGFFALIALMPDFDGRNGADWGQQEGDEEEAGR
jgi:hypothetical protein